MCGSNHAVAFLSCDCEAIISQLQLRSYNIYASNKNIQKLNFSPSLASIQLLLFFNSYDDGTKCKVCNYELQKHMQVNFGQFTVVSDRC